MANPLIPKFVTVKELISFLDELIRNDPAVEDFAVVVSTDPEDNDFMLLRRRDGAMPVNTEHFVYTGYSGGIVVEDKPPNAVALWPN